VAGQFGLRLLNKPFTSVAFLTSGVLLVVASGVTSNCAAAFFVSRVLSLQSGRNTAERLIVRPQFNSVQRRRGEIDRWSRSGNHPKLQEEHHGKQRNCCNCCG
jgi:hypothetical protein